MTDDQFMRLDSLMQELVGREGARHNEETITRLFNLNNEITGILEYSKSCGSCRSRVYNRMKEIWYGAGGVKKH